MQVLFGHTTIWDIEHYGVKEEISGALNSMRAISVRDANSCEIVEKLTRMSLKFMLIRFCMI